MGPELTAAPRATGCPSCGASARPDAQWCGQCYADLRPATAPAPAPVPPAPTAVYGEPAPDPLTAPLLALAPELPAAPAPAAAEPTWPCLSCQERNPLSASSCLACGSGFLAAARSGDAGLSLPLVGDLTTMSRGKRAAVAAGLVAAVLVPLALLTLLTTKSPPAETTGTDTVTTVSTP